jgi:hypothetical protein
MPPGIYSYSVIQDWTWYQTTIDSASVVVGTPPPLDPLLTQRTYQYQTRVGDINADGRQDLFINRVSGGVADNGVLEKVIVQQTATPDQYTLVVPTSAQASTAAGWPLSSAQVAVEDINVDGFVDVAVNGLANAINVAGAKNLIVYSSGQPFNPVPKGSRVVDDTVLRFAANMLDYQANPDYFATHAPVNYFYVTYSWSTCGNGVVTNDIDLVTYSAGCIFVVQTVVGYYPDYSQFAGAAVAIWESEKNYDAGQVSRGVALDKASGAVKAIIQSDIGGWDYSQVMGESGPGADADYRRALDIFMVILGIGRAEAQEVISYEAPAQTPRFPGVIYLTHRKLVLGILGSHVALEYAASPTDVDWVSATDTDTRIDFNGKLKAQNKYGPDNPFMMAKLGSITPADQEAPGTFWTTVLKVGHGHYMARPDSELLNYHPNPNTTPEVDYNSNGYIHGLVDWSWGTSSYPFSSLVGGNPEVPVGYFN